MPDIAAGPWPEADPEIEAAKDAVVMEMMGVGDIDLRAKRVITALWQLGWRPSTTPDHPSHNTADGGGRSAR